MGITIKELSERSGVKIPTIRYYERQSLLPEPERTVTGQRRYGSVDVARLQFVRFSRGLGMEVGELRALIEMVGEGNGEEIVVAAETIAERAERMWVLCASLRSVSAGIIAGTIDEAEAFDRLMKGEGRQAEEPTEDLPSEVVNGAEELEGDAAPLPDPLSAKEEIHAGQRTKH